MLLSTVFVVLVLGLVLRAAMIRMPSALHSKQSQQRETLSMLAARSGLDYAIYRFRTDPAWEGGTVRKVVLDQEGLTVIEEDGLVLGEMKTEGGPTLYFRFCFKAEDVGKELISLNNLDSDVPTKLPRPEGEPGTFEVPPHSVCLFVEGGVGALDELELDRTDDEPRSRRAPGKVVEAIYRLVPDGGVKDAVAMAAGDLSLDVARNGGQVYLSGTFLGNAGGDALRLRSKKRIVVTSGGSGVGQLKLADRTDAELGQYYGVSADYDASKVTLVDEFPSDGQDFYNLTWDQIPTISGSKTRETARIPGGVYVYGTGASNRRELRYYDMSYEGYLENARELASSSHSSGSNIFSNVSPFSPFNNPRIPTGNSLNPLLPGSTRTTGNTLNGMNGINPINGIRNSGSNSSNSSQTVRDATPPPFKGFSFGPGTVSYYPNGASKPTKYEGFRFNVNGKNLKVVPSASGREDLVIIPESPQKFDIGDKTEYPSIKTKYNPDHFYMTIVDSTITVPGDVIIQGGVNGKGGSIVSEGDISILAGKTLELASQGRSDAEMDRELEAQKGIVEQLASGAQHIVKPTLSSASLQLNLYSKGKLTLSTFVDRADSYRSLTFRGLLYSWGDIQVWAGKGTSADRGTLTLQGAIVAYGNDPTRQDPGGGGGGTIDIRAKDINLAWDPRYLPSLSELQSDNQSTFALRQARLRQIR